MVYVSWYNSRNVAASASVDFIVQGKQVKIELFWYLAAAAFFPHQTDTSCKCSRVILIFATGFGVGVRSAGKDLVKSKIQDGHQGFIFDYLCKISPIVFLLAEDDDMQYGWSLVDIEKNVTAWMEHPRWPLKSSLLV